MTPEEHDASCARIEEEVARLRAALAESHAREAALREAVERAAQCGALSWDGVWRGGVPAQEEAEAAIAALRAILADPSPAAEALLADAAFGRACRDEPDRSDADVAERRHTLALSRRRWIDAACAGLGDDGWSGDPDALRAALTAMRDKARRCDEADRAVLLCAQAVGIVYQADGHNDEAGPPEAVADAVRSAIRRADAAEAEVARVTAERDEARADQANEAWGMQLERETNAESAALREAYERDERVECQACAKPPGQPPFPRGYVWGGSDSGWEPCRTCHTLGTVRAPLPDPSPAVAAMLAAREVAEAVRSEWATPRTIGALARYEAARAAETKP